MRTKILNEKMIVSSILCILPIVIGLILYDQIPEQMPIHWDTAGKANGFIAKTLGIWGVPVFLLAIHFVVVIGTVLKNQEQKMAKMTLLISYWAVPVASVLIEPLALLKAAGYEVNMTRVVLSLVGILFIITGNYMPKNQPNTAAGYRLPWTLQNVNNWKRTHLIAGKLWIFVGFIMVICGWTSIGDSWLLIVLMIVAFVVPMIYSFVTRNCG